MSSADRTRRIALCASLTALACILGLVEASVLPPLPLPGIKLGLANIAVLIAFVLLGRSGALFVSVCRVLVVGSMTGTLLGPTGALSLGGALAAWAVVALLSIAGERFSIVGWSVAGSAVHVGTQFLLASAISGILLPPLMAALSLAASVVTGLSVGLASMTVLKSIRQPLAITSSRTAGVCADGAAAGG